MPGYLGLDIGTTGIKSTLFNEKGIIFNYAYEEYSLINDKDDCYELDPDAILNAAKRVIASSIFEQSQDVKAICITSFGESIVLMDKCDHVLCNSMVYLDKRGHEEALSLEAVLGVESIARIAGLKSHAMYTFPKLLYLIKNNPRMIEKARKICFIADYVAYCLGAEHMTDYSLASRSMGLDINKKAWWDKALEALGISKEILPKLIKTGSITGKVSKKIAIETGLSTNTEILIGGHDQIANALGAGVLEAGSSVNGIGTADCITPAFTMPEDPLMMTGDNYCIVPYIKDNLYVTYAFNMTGGALLKWYRDNFAIDIKNELKNSSKSVYEVLNERMPKGPTDLLVQPYFAGSSTPRMDVYAKGAVIGLRLDTDRYSFYRSILEGETYEMMYNIDSLFEKGIKINEVRTVGGGSRSDEWLQLRADILNRNIYKMSVEEAGTLGCAIMASTATGEYSSIDEGCTELVRMKKVFAPDKNNTDKYKSQYERYKRMYDAINNVWSRKVTGN